MQENASMLLAAHYFGIIWPVLSCLPIQVVIMIADKSTENHSYVPYEWLQTQCTEWTLSKPQILLAGKFLM